MSTLSRSPLVKVWTGESFAISLLLAFTDHYGYDDQGKENFDFLNWDPGTILLHLQDDFGIEVPQANFDRLMTAIALKTTDEFFRNAIDFSHFCKVLSGGLYDPTMSAGEMADSFEIAWGVTEAAIIEPPQEKEPFSPDVVVYIQKALEFDGLVVPPAVLAFVNRTHDIGRKATDGFSGDAATYGAMYETMIDRTTEIDTVVKATLAALVEQVESLPLKHGRPDKIIQAITGANQ